MIEKFGVGPDKVIEVQALIGDSTDNVPGVPGIGVKTAAQLIGEYGDLETLLKRAGEIKQDKRRQSLIDNAEIARISKRLVTLDQNVPLDVPVDQLAVHEPDYKHLIAFLKAMEFNTITRRVAEKAGIDASQVEADAQARRRARPPAARRAAPARQNRRSVRAAAASQAAAAKAERTSALTPISLAAARAEAARKQKIDRSKYECVRTLARLKDWIARAHETGVVAVDTETTSLDADAGRPVRLLARASRRTKPATCRSAITKDGGGDGLVRRRPRARPDQGSKTRCKSLKPLLEDKSVLKVGQNLKYDWLVFAQRGIEIAGYDDTMLISYVLDAGKGGHGMDDLSERWLGPQDHPLRRRRRHGQIAGHASIASPSTRRPNTPPRTPT